MKTGRNRFVGQLRLASFKYVDQIAEFFVHFLFRDHLESWSGLLAHQFPPALAKSVDGGLGHALEPICFLAGDCAPNIGPK